jgi:hypothetical protein
VVSRDEKRCYNCGDTKPASRAVVQRQPVSAWSNTVFIVALAFTFYFFLVERKLSLSLTMAISTALMLLRLAAEWIAKRN